MLGPPLVTVSREDSVFGYGHDSSNSVYRTDSLTLTSTGTSARHVLGHWVWTKLLSPPPTTDATRHVLGTSFGRGFERLQLSRRCISRQPLPGREERDYCMTMSVCVVPAVRPAKPRTSPHSSPERSHMDIAVRVSHSAH
jgi:hypothetical protein